MWIQNNLLFSTDCFNVIESKFHFECQFSSGMQQRQRFICWNSGDFRNLFIQKQLKRIG